MKAKEFLCMSLNCKNTVLRHPYNFDDGFCVPCKEEKNANWRSKNLHNNF